MRTISIRKATLVSLVFMLMLSMAACAANKPATSAGPGNGHTAPAASASSAPAHSATPAAPSARTAAQDPAAFFSAARQTDTRLRTAATMVNGGITTNAMRISQATVNAVRAADPQPVAAAMPAGMDPALLRQALLVYSELESRYMAMYRLPVGVTASSGSGLEGPGTYQYLMRCLGNGAAAASRFAADLAALEKTAGAAPPVTIAAPDSRAAAELALRIYAIGGQNAGCASCGGQLATTLVPITWGWQGTWMGTWGDGSTAPPDGTISGIVPFRVSYQAGKGWFAQMAAC